jgi:hypothetical protein
MRFLFTMHMPSFSGNLVHQVIGDYPAESLAEMTDIIANSDFIIVNEIYKNDDGRNKPIYFEKGEVSLNCLHIGKVKAFAA